MTSNGLKSNFEFDESFEKGYNEENDEEYFREFDIPSLENLHTFTFIYYFSLKNENWKNWKAYC